MTKRLSIRVNGLVQGVFFRHTAKQTASSLNLSGFARNEADGSVQLEVQGEESALQNFVAWCHVGSSTSQVESVETQEIDVVSEKGFSIK